MVYALSLWHSNNQYLGFCPWQASKFITTMDVCIIGENDELFSRVHCLFIVKFSQHRRRTISAACKSSCSGPTGQRQCVYVHMFFTRFQQITWFRNFHEVVNVDATRGTNHEGYKGNSFVIAQVQIVSILSRIIWIRAFNDFCVCDQWKVCVLQVMFPQFRDMMAI